MGGNSSSFKININGNQTIQEDNIEIAANDSIYIFVSAFVNPTATTTPFIIIDSILVNYNGIDRFVQLEAYGKNAHFINNQVFSGTTTWQNDLPYVVLGNLFIDTTATLIIEEGTKIYVHGNASLIVDGSLIINGTKNKEVQFAGDRLDDYYKDIPGSWQGIFLRDNSKDNSITFAIIKNAVNGIVVENTSINSNPKLVIHQSIIDNAMNAGLKGFNSSIQADNCLISNCGNNIQIQYGGIYSFSNCTVAAYSNSFMLHQSPVLQITNAAIVNGNNLTADLDASFVNCIFWSGNGSIEDEVEAIKEGNNPFNVLLQNCIFKAISDPQNVTLQSSTQNEDPVFDSIDVENRYYDFRITKEPLSPALNTGTVVAFPFDLDNNPRPVGITDIGSYERQ